jgi:hypothetical protein
MNHTWATTSCLEAAALHETHYHRKYGNEGERLYFQAFGLTTVFIYLKPICRRGTAMLCPYRLVYLPENSCKLTPMSSMQLSVSLTFWTKNVSVSQINLQKN